MRSLRPEGIEGGSLNGAKAVDGLAEAVKDSTLEPGADCYRERMSRGIDAAPRSHTGKITDGHKDELAVAKTYHLCLNGSPATTFDKAEFAHFSRRPLRLYRKADQAGDPAKNR
jgi:hypothetical protein